jgi:hypothetical protein
MERQLYPRNSKGKERERGRGRRKGEINGFVMEGCAKGKHM